MSAFENLVTDLEQAIHDGQQDKRVALLRQLTDLFVVGAKGFTDENIDLFGDVLTGLANQVESKVLAEVSAKLAPIENAPNVVMQRFARHDEIAIAHPVLAHSPRLSDDDLVEIASTKGQAHLGAISERPRLAAMVTDVLVERGDTTVVRKLSLNQGAVFSSAGFDALAGRAQADAQLAENLGGRVDLPPEVLRKLVAEASEKVRARLLAGAPPERQADIQKAIDTVSAQVAGEVSASSEFGRAEKLIDRLKKMGKLDEKAIVNFAETGRYSEMVVGLSRLCLAPIDLLDPIVRNPSYDGLLTTFRACDFSWQTFAAILNHRFPGHPLSVAEREKASADFHKMSPATAKRIYRFWLVRGVASAH